MSTNPFKEGDVVVATSSLWNGTGEGGLWRVRKTNRNWVYLTPLHTVTGPSVLRDKRVQFFGVAHPKKTDLRKMLALPTEMLK